jgi:GNAT superfamily N-acetyltransferase
MIVRRAEPEDAMAVARVHVRSWQVAYRGLMPDAFLDQLKAEDRAERYDFGTRDREKPETIVAAEGSNILGFATVSPSRDEDLPGYGELCALYADPELWGRGIGVALMKAARGRLFEMGFQQALLWLLVGNARAGRFYGIDGWRTDGHRRTNQVWSLPVDEVRYVREIEAED